MHKNSNFFWLLLANKSLVVHSFGNHLKQVLLIKGDPLFYSGLKL